MYYFKNKVFIIPLFLQKDMLVQISCGVAIFPVVESGGDNT